MALKEATPNDAIYSETQTEHGPRMLPSDYASGPWNAAHQHGGAVSGLLARALDRLEAPAPMRLTRLTVEMFRGVPLEPLRIETTTLREGLRIQSAEARLFSGTPGDETLVARATGMRIRSADHLPELDTQAPFDRALGEPASGPTQRRTDVVVPNDPGFIRAIDIQSQMPERCGEPATVWTRLKCRFMQDEDTPPIVALAALCDLASGTGNAMDYARYTSINPDLTIHVLRPPRTDWIGIRGTTQRAADGIGQSSATIFDLEGEIARVQACLLLDRRD